MKKRSKLAFLALSVAGIVCAVVGIRNWSARWIESAGLIFDIAGIVQLEISGLFEKILDRYGDEKKYPFGPPSHITREMMDDPDRPVRAWLRDRMFYEHDTGFWLLVLGFAFQLWANWLA